MRFSQHEDLPLCINRCASTHTHTHTRTVPHHTQQLSSDARRSLLKSIVETYDQVYMYMQICVD